MTLVKETQTIFTYQEERKNATRASVRLGRPAATKRESMVGGLWESIEYESTSGLCDATRASAPSIGEYRKLRG
ncbi:uncharacterized protein ColSpa_05082 [Colletotrichum spaethianum]|uniref:Uncharacterized protein n=1 Tax=Colletotrichum spaethianum TaxID=700344 RepID=A0AA37P5X4_9PEZI|nr:uncharacterized protein ColSpa_05082 [Colletotrichum spaethianum]GKT44901.1 hypothetical protein ColSpa_05082 [Colletotrichum spaethianum]